MPIYEYDCPECGVFEVTQRITEKPLSRCPTCRIKVRKLISQTSFQLKGSGWYLTDYARRNSNSSGDKPKTGSAPEKAAETKTSTETPSTTTSSESKT